MIHSSSRRSIKCAATVCLFVCLFLSFFLSLFVSPLSMVSPANGLVEGITVPDDCASTGGTTQINAKKILSKRLVFKQLLKLLALLQNPNKVFLYVDSTYSFFSTVLHEELAIAFYLHPIEPGGKLTCCV